MDFTFTVTYNRALVRRALRHFMVARMGWSGIGGLIVAGLLLVSEYMLGYWGIHFIVLATVYALLLALIALIYLIRLRSSESFFEKVKSPSVKFIFDEEGVKTESDIGSSKVKWLAFDELLKFSDMWLLIYGKSGYVTIPLDQISPECGVFIEQKLKDGVIQ